MYVSGMYVGYVRMYVGMLWLYVMYVTYVMCVHNVCACEYVCMYVCIMYVWCGRKRVRI